MATIRLTRRQWSTKWRQKLVEDHRPLVEKIARDVRRGMTHIDLDELISCGNVGLIEAVTRYQRDAGVFSHFAYFRIRGAMIDAHKRAAYRNDTHASIAEIDSRLGFIPAKFDTDSRSLPPDEMAARREQARLLAAAVAELDPDEKLVFCRALAGVSLADTAAECGHSVAWTRIKLASARAQLGARVISWGLGLDRAA